MIEPPMPTSLYWVVNYRNASRKRTVMRFATFEQAVEWCRKRRPYDESKWSVHKSGKGLETAPLGFYPRLSIMPSRSLPILAKMYKREIKTKKDECDNAEKKSVILEAWQLPIGTSWNQIIEVMEITEPLLREMRLAELRTKI